MKIAYLCSVYPRITHTFIRREILGLEEHGIVVTRITIRRANDPTPTPEDIDERQNTLAVLEQGLTNLLFNSFVVAISRPKYFVRTLWRAYSLGLNSQSGLIAHLAYVAEACLILRYVRKEEVRHIHAHFGKNAAMVAMLVRCLGGPTYSFTAHGCGEWDSPEFLHIPEKIEKSLFAVAISNFAKSQLYRWSAPKHWEKIHVVRCGVDQSFISNPVTDVPDVDRLLMIARIDRTKGHIFLLEALQQLFEEGIQFHIRLIGDGPLREFVERQVTERGLGKCVEILGWMDNNVVREEILASRGLLLTSFAEGLPVVIMEALALCRPVISSRVGGVGELVVHGDNGWLFNSGSVEELVYVLRTLLRTPAARLTEMGCAGRQAVLQKHNASHEANKLAELLRKYVGDPTGDI